MPGAPSEEHVQALRKQLAEARATINMALRDSEEHRDKAEALADQLAHKSHEIKRLNAEIESLLMQVRTMQEQNEMLENALEAQNIQQPAPKSAVPDHEQDTMLDGATSVSRRPSKPPQRASSLKSLQRLMPAQSSSVSLALELAEMDTNAKLAQAVKKLQRENVSLVRSLVATLESVSRIK
nr:hypothetical protein HK105_003066 [Polyrhizophydium stewartii]